MNKNHWDFNKIFESVTGVKPVITRPIYNGLNEGEYIVYHGTNNQFDKFDLNRATQGIIWFTDSIDTIKNNTHGGLGSKIIMKRKIILNNPAGWPEYEKYGLGQIRGMGYDGIILPQDGYNDYIVFSPKSIKMVKDDKPVLEGVNLNLKPQEQQIVDDILSMNEDIAGMKNKIIQYGQKGLITLAILFALSQNVSANDKADVIKTGIEYVDDVAKKDFYSACVGYVAQLGSKEQTDQARLQALKECRVYFENVRDGLNPKPLSQSASIVYNFVLDNISKASPIEIGQYIQTGKNLQTK